MNQFLEIFRKMSLIKKIVTVYLIFLASNILSFVLVLFSDSFNSVIYILTSILVLRLTLEIYYSFDLKKQRMYFLLTVIICPIIYLLNKDGNILLGFVGNVLGIYFFVSNLFVLSIAGLIVSFVPISKKTQYFLVFVAAIILSFAFIFDDFYKFYTRPQLTISTENSVKVEPTKLNDKFLISVVDNNTLSTLKLNPFYPDLIIGSDEGCGCSYWETSNENEKDFWNQNIGSNLIERFDEYSFSKGKYYKLLIDNNGKGITLLVQDDSNGTESYYNKVTITGGYIRTRINERGDNLQKDYYSRSFKLFTYQNIFIYVYQTLYDVIFKESNKEQVVKILDESIRSIINVNEK